MDEGSILIRGVKCQVIRPALPGDRVLVYHYPYENDDSQVERALSQFGLVKDVSHHSWVGLKDVHTGTRVVRMDRTTRIPRSIMIDGFRCKIWYQGQQVSVPSCPSVLSGASSSSVEGGAPDCRGSSSAVSNVASCSSNVSSVASVCNSNVVDDNGLLIDKVSNGNSSNVMDSAISNVSGDPSLSNVSNIVNASKVSWADNVSNIDNTNASAGKVRRGCPDSGVPLFDLADGVASDSPPSSGDSEMVPASGTRKRPATSLPWRTHWPRPA